MKGLFETERLFLKRLDPQDAHLVHAFYMDNKGFLEPFEEMRPPQFYTLAFQKKCLEIEEISFLKGKMVRFWLFLKQHESEACRDVIGTVSLSNIMRGAFQSCFIGYKMDHRHLNHGYMTEAISEVIRIAFNDMHLHRIEANIMPKNKPSLRVVEKLGFENEGLAKKLIKINGKWEDHFHMVIINDDV